MTDTLQRPVDTGPPAAEPPTRRVAPPPPPPSHPHFTLASLAGGGVILALVALGVAIASLFVLASRNSVDDRIVEDRVAEVLESGDLSIASAALRAGESVIPELTPKAELPVATEINVSVAPEVPAQITRTNQAIVAVHFEVVENVVAIDPANGVEYETWGYRIAGDDTVIGTPGPMIRARVGDVLQFTITNPAGNTHPHNVDFHAVTGQGGGAADTVVSPGETVTIEARLLYPGMFMYHCATADVPSHIIHGMYGGILVDPATPLPAVEHEWYIVQSEFYTTSKDPGLVDTDRQAATDENPSYVVFNGQVGAIAGDNALEMGVGETARLYFVNAGLNLDSNFHPIGSHWDAVYPEAALLNPPLRGSQTTLVPAGGGTVVEMIGQVPQTVVLVDHALTRTFDKGALGMITITGEENPEIFEAVATAPTDTDASAGDDQAAPADQELTILDGAWTTQDMDDPNEFSDGENPADYSVNVLRVPVGTTVRWTNEDTVPHTVTDAAGSFDSGFFNQGESWSYTFDAAGEFEYFCTPHPWMRAKVIVEE